MNIIFADRNKEFIDEVRKVFGQSPNISTIVGDIESVNTVSKAFVSPANCFCLMSGGIDAVYNCRMFRGIETKVKNTMNQLGKTSKYGNKYLPIGSAIVTPINSLTCLISAPTMYLPHNISKTQNAYHAFMAILCAFHQYRQYNQLITHLVCPALCTGYGKMAINIAVNQMYQAYLDWHQHKRPSKVNFINDPQIYMTTDESIMGHQPIGYDEDEPYSVGNNRK
jgi:O-acetyl-ADP-ribose deacetylase (regulator of RNase III)